MTNDNIYFVANWKMYGNLSSISPLKKVIKLVKSKIFRKIKIIYCPPFTLIEKLASKTAKTSISVGAQDCHFMSGSGPYTGKISSYQIKKLGAKYVIIGHSENRALGETDQIINRKIKVVMKDKLIPIFCIGETYSERRKKNTNLIIKKQLRNGLKNIKNLKNIIIAYEPVWSIGSGLIPSNNQIIEVLSLIRKYLKKKNVIILYGGSVNNKNIKDLKKVETLNGFLIGGSSQKVNKFVDIVKKTIN